jgi:hypothetical protein
LVRRVWQRRCQPQLLIPTQQFHGTVVLDALSYRQITGVTTDIYPRTGTGKLLTST